MKFVMIRLALITILLASIHVGAAASPDFSSTAAKQARDSYEKRISEADVKYYRELQAAQKVAMTSGNLTEANLIQAELDRMKERLVKTAPREKREIVVKAEDTGAAPRATGIKLQKGQRFSLKPSAVDKWTGGGTKKGVFCDYMGYDDRGNTWMRLMWRNGKGKEMPVVSGKILVAENDGELLLYANDGKAAGNEGEIRVNILVSPK